MSNAYRTMMEKQTLSERADAAFYAELKNAEPRRKQKLAVRVVAIAACICVLVPMIAIAAENLFGVGLVDFFKRDLIPGKNGEGYDVTFTNVYGRPISDFSPELQSLDGHKRESYASWEEAEEELGFGLMTNAVLSDEKTVPEKTYDPEIDPDDSPRRTLYHCMADYNGKAGQLYCANIRAAYKCDGMFISVSATVTAEHPAVSQEETEAMHQISATYTGVEQMDQEQYGAGNGLTATIVAIDRVGRQSTCYEAGFVANGVSYHITVDGYSVERNAEAKQLLIDILEGFSFEADYS